jgi:hypothetical protein
MQAEMFLGLKARMYFPTLHLAYRWVLRLCVSLAGYALPCISCTSPRYTWPTGDCTVMCIAGHCTALYCLVLPMPTQHPDLLLRACRALSVTCAH